jgi:signal transduction histidine kinase
VQRLSRLHQSLLLLTKVENRQFILNEPVQLDQVFMEKCGEYAERAESMHLTVHMDLAPTPILFHNHLADILVNNLLNNAMRYNIAGGTIDIRLDDKQLSVSNTSAGGMLDSGRLFKRFYRGNTVQEGTGLGLSIVKQICELAGYLISYKYSDGTHTFEIRFN